MTFCTPFLQLNFINYNLGSYIGTCLGQRFFGNLWSQFQSSFSPMPIVNNCNFSVQNYANTSIFNTGNYFSASPVAMTSGFDTVSLGNTSQSLGLSVQPNFGGQIGLPAISSSGYTQGNMFLSNSSITPFGISSTSVSTPVSKTSNISNKKVANLEWWKEQGYNEEMGKKLAENTKKNSDSLRSQEITGQCGKGVRLGINETFGTKYENFPQARLTGDEILKNDKHFKKIDISDIKLDAKNIPAGAIIIYGAGYSSGKNSHCGHIEVSDGNGKGYSDLTTTLLSNYGRHRAPKEIWIPV